jgi:hypothetical protein
MLVLLSFLSQLRHRRRIQRDLVTDDSRYARSKIAGFPTHSTPIPAPPTITSSSTASSTSSTKPHRQLRALSTSEELEPAEADAIKEAATRVLKGESLRSITMDWNRRSVKTVGGS